MFFSDKKYIFCYTNIGDNMNRRNALIIIGILAFIMIVGGVSYSYFVYNKDIGDVSFSMGGMKIELNKVTNNINLTSAIPVSNFIGKESTNYLDFTINSTVDTERLYYEVYIVPKKDNTINPKYINLYLTDQNDNEKTSVKSYNELKDSKKGNGKVIYKDIIELNESHTSKNDSENFRLRLWIDESYSITSSKTFDFDIYLYAFNVDKDYVIN